MLQMENQKLRSKVAQLEVQIAEMKAQMKNGPYSGKCTYELGFSNTGQNTGSNIGQSIRSRQSNMSSSVRMSSTSMQTKTKLSKVESSPLPGTRPRIISSQGKFGPKRAVLSTLPKPWPEMRIMFWSFSLRFWTTAGNRNEQEIHSCYSSWILETISSKISKRVFKRSKSKWYSRI